MRRLLAFLAPLAILVAGCAQTESISVVRADGSVERKVLVSIDNTQNPAAAEDGGTKPSSVIRFHSEAGWKVEEKKGEKGQDIVSGARNLKPGEVLQEEFTLNDNNDGLASCVAKTEKTADGLIVYTETWTWKGKVEADGSPVENMAKVVAEKLGPWGVSDAEQKAIVDRVGKKAWKALFGPGDPLVGMLLTNPNQGVRRLNNIMATAFLEELEVVPGKTHEERIKVVREMVNGLDATDMTTPEPPAGDPEAGGNADLMVSILSRVKGPGQVVDHNGEMDVLEDEVFWSMYLEASMMEPVVLRAVFRP